jgi:hypothetical protein
MGTIRLEGHQIYDTWIDGLQCPDLNWIEIDGHSPEEQLVA